MLYPVPAVLVGCRDEEGRDNLMTAAWAGTICSDPVMVSVSIRRERYSHDIIERTGVFTLSLTTEELALAADFCGVRSGRDTDKFREMKLTPLESVKIRAPGVSESPVVLECLVRQILRLGSHDMFIAEVVNVSVDEQYMNENGRLMLERADLIAYSHGEYFTLGDRIGKFGYSVRRKGGTAKAGAAAGKSAPKGVRKHRESGKPVKKYKK
jgi:flavin reductase (DIM6/NTAB) family NADH-FMN oxidoreductase RutF